MIGVVEVRKGEMEIEDKMTRAEALGTYEEDLTEGLLDRIAEQGVTREYHGSMSVSTSQPRSLYTPKV